VVFLLVLSCSWRGGAHSAGGREGAVDIEEADGILDRAVGERRDDARGGSGGDHGVLLLWWWCCDWYIFLYVYVYVWLRALEGGPLWSCVGANGFKIGYQSDDRSSVDEGKLDVYTNVFCEGGQV
jgi:hypothetical protein